MKSSAIAACAATLALHALLVVAVVRGLAPQLDKPATPPAVIVQLVPPSVEPAAPLPSPPSPPSPFEPPPPPPKEKPAPARPDPKPVPKPLTKPAPKPIPKQEPKPPSKPELRPTPKPSAEPPSSSDEKMSPAPEAPPSPSAAATVPPALPAPVAPQRTDVSIPASYAASNRKPAYPALSRRYDEQGTVVLRVLVQADGRAGAVEIKSSSGHPRLDESARSTVQTWRFHPATVDGKPVAEWYQLAIPFKLQD